MYTYPCRKFCTHFPEFPPTASLCLSAQRAEPSYSQHPQLSDCQSCQTPHYTVSSQRRIHFNDMMLYWWLGGVRVAGGWGGYYLFKGTVTGWVARGGLRSRNGSIISPSGQTFMRETESRGLLKQPLSADFTGFRGTTGRMRSRLEDIWFVRWATGNFIAVSVINNWIAIE